MSPMLGNAAGTFVEVQRPRVLHEPVMLWVPGHTAGVALRDLNPVFASHIERLAGCLQEGGADRC